MQLQTMLRLRPAWLEAEGPHHEVVLSSRARLARNLKDAPFPSNAAGPALKRVLGEAVAAARRTALREAAFLTLDDLDAVDRTFLVERHLISPALAASPRQRGVIVGAQESLSVMVNEEDHLRLACFAPGLSLKSAWKEADALDDALGEALPYAFRPDWGYLTACPTNLGTGLRASCLVHLPALAQTGHLNRVLEGLSRAGLIARGFYGEGTRIVGDILQVSNATGLGRTEAEMVTAIEKAVTALVEREREAREQLLKGGRRLETEDRVHRAASLLAGARVMSFTEGCHQLSALRLGHALGWDLPGDLSAVNELLLLSQPAHLAMRAGRELSEPEAAVLRASLLRERLGRPR